jgi:hypothetical protein
MLKNNVDGILEKIHEFKNKFLSGYKSTFMSSKYLDQLEEVFMRFLKMFTGSNFPPIKMFKIYS